ncbi:hypothetical protein TYRP_005395, partial [Tyrophagus putrescentiae]
LWGAVFHSLPLTYQQWGRLYQKFLHALVLLFAAQLAPSYLAFRVKLTHQKNALAKSSRKTKSNFVRSTFWVGLTHQDNSDRKLRIFCLRFSGQFWGAVFHSLPLTYQEWQGRRDGSTKSFFMH